MTSRRIVATAAVAIAVAAGLIAAGPAAARCPDGPCQPPDPGGSTMLVTHTLTVTRSAGVVASTPSGIACGADCSETDSQLVACDLGVCDPPDPTLWQTYTLSATGGAGGFVPDWSGCAPDGDGRCSVTLDADQSVHLGWKDVQAPTVSLLQPAIDAKVGTTMTVSGTATDNDQVARVDVVVDGAPRATGFTSPYTATVDMSMYAGGPHTVTFRATDRSGQVAQVTHAVTVDRHVALTLGGALPDYTSAPSVPLAITTDPDATTSCSLDAAAAAPCAGTYAPDLGPVADGPHTYRVVATDDVGNTASASRSFFLDRAAPTVSQVDGPAEGAQVTTSSVTMSFAVADVALSAVDCALDEVPHPCTSATTDVLSGLAPGTHRFTLTATDKAGNRTTMARTFSVAAPATGAPPVGPTPPGGTVPGGAPAPQSGASGTPSAAPAGRPGLRPNHARLRYRYQRTRGWTRLRTLSVGGLEKGSTIRVTCDGGRRAGCPRAHYRFTARHRTLDLRALRRHKLRPGVVITIRVSKPGTETRTLRLTIRRAKGPRLH